MPDFHGKGADFKRDLMGDVQDMVGRMLSNINATFAAQQNGVVQSDQHRVMNFQGPGVTVTDDPTSRRTNIYIPGSPISSSTTTSIGSTVGQGSGLYLWNGSANNAPPANWQLASFDHSSWTTTIGSSNTTRGAPNPLIGTAWVTINNSQFLPTTAEWLFFQAFTLPAGVITTATLRVQFDDYSRGVWINGTQVIPADSSFTGVSTNSNVSIDPTILVAGGSNSIAIWDRNNQEYIAVDWLLTVVQSTSIGSSAVTAVLAADVTLTLANTFYDVLSLTLGVGTWFVIAQLQLDPAVSTQETTKLWDGTTTFATAGQQTTKIEMGFIQALIVLGSSTAVKVSAANNTAAGHIRAAALFNASGNTATSLTALRMA